MLPFKEVITHFVTVHQNFSRAKKKQLKSVLCKLSLQKESELTGKKDKLHIIWATFLSCKLSSDPLDLSCVPPGPNPHIGNNWSRLCLIQLMFLSLSTGHLKGRYEPKGCTFPTRYTTPLTIQLN